MLRSPTCRDVLRSVFEPETAINQFWMRFGSTYWKKMLRCHGFNIGMNSGETAGQTVAHTHVHLIPRREGDVQEPRGGVRRVIPGKAVY